MLRQRFAAGDMHLCLVSLFYELNFCLNKYNFYKCEFCVAVDIMDADEIPLTVDNSKSGNSKSASSGEM